MGYNSAIEQIFDESKAFIMAHLPSLLHEYAVEQPGLPLPVPNKIIRGDYGFEDVMKINWYPLVVVNPGSVQMGQNELSTTTKNGMSLDFAWWIFSALNVNTNKFEAIENLQKINERYAWAIYEIITGSSYIPTQTTLVNSIRSVKGIDWGIVEHSNNLAVSAVFVDINIKIAINRV